MDAMTLLKKQHREVSALFEKFEETEDDVQKIRIFEQIADELAVHATIEERHFYPALRSAKTKDDLAEANDEHLEVKKLLLDCMRSTSAPGFDAKVAALQGAVEHHVEEEEEELFVKAKKLLSKDALESLGQSMEAEAEQMKAAGAPRKKVTEKIEAPAAHP